MQIGQAHTAEEARHISYARKWLETGMACLDDDQVKEVQGLAEFGASMLVTGQEVLPVQYGEQLAPLLTRQEFDEAQAGSQARAKLLVPVKKLLDDFESLHVVSHETMRRWEDSGAFDG